MELRRGLRDWLLAKDSDPSVRLRVLRDILDRPTDDPAVARAQKEVGRRGWAAQILNGQHTEGHWVTPAIPLGSCTVQSTSRRIGGSSSCPTSGSRRRTLESPGP